MKVTSAAAIIPARFASTRFPGKPLFPILGRPMIEWVYNRTARASTLQRVYVATDDDRIASVVREFGGEVILTDPGHPTGTDRIAEAARMLPGFDVIVNVQGDEPLIAPESIDLAVRALISHAGASAATLIASCSLEEYHSPNVVKALVDRDGYALYFSRAPVPYARRGEPGAAAWKHIGLYAYRQDFLIDFAQWPPTPLETCEALEQLRVLEMGRRIACAVTPYFSLGVDTPGDVAVIEARLSEENHA